MTRRVFTAGIVTETNTFAPYRTGITSFKEMMLLLDGEEPDPPHGFDLCQPFIKRARSEGWDVSVGVRAFAMPSGLLSVSCYEELRDELLGGLIRAMPVDAVLLSLHGAMASEAELDCEGAILEEVRRIVGPTVPVGAHIDPHCHLTKRMVISADVIRIWKEYPHTDIRQRADEVFDFIKAQLAGAPRPIPVVKKCRFTQLLHTTRDPMRSFVDKVSQLEKQDGIHSISVGHSFPWGDVPDLGTNVLVYATSAEYTEIANDLAETLAHELECLSMDARTPYLDMEEALDRAFSHQAGPVVIADCPDNPGIGAPGDSTFFLDELLRRGVGDWAIGYICDPQAVRLAIEAGQGETIDLRVGGKTCRLSGEPIDVRGKVAEILLGAQVRFGKQHLSVGDSVSIDLGSNRFLLLISKRNQTFDSELFTSLGIDLTAMQVVVVKSSQHFYITFEPLASLIIYAAPPGVATPAVWTLDYRYADTSIWPLSGLTHNPPSAD